MIINIAHTKGGVGKTTIATNLAVELNASILDLDLQGSSLRFSELRNDNDIKPALTVYKVSKDSLYKESFINQLSNCKGSHHNHLVIDSGGMDNNIIREGIVIADMIITPLGVSQVEFFGLQDFDELLKSIDRDKTYVLLNNVNLQAKKNLCTAEDLISSNFNFKLLHSKIANRIAYKEAYGEGKSVVELDKKSKAALEIKALIQEIQSNF